ncbi:MAG: lipopolysaccharide kinase InaA family protein [Gammaproteobacteria bacterium]|jgi:tRNA A-37 threonylcarbamoyl transferase component Bud32
MTLSNPYPRLLSKHGRSFYLHPDFARDAALVGLQHFDDFWGLPAVYVDEINERRGGWSAVSQLKIESPQGSALYYVKRQENQLRRSLSHPFGTLTYHYELAAIQRNLRMGLPAVEVVGSGFLSGADFRRGILITRALKAKPLADLIESKPDWNTLTPLLQRTGELLYRMHTNRISHGALYPNHIYFELDPEPDQLQSQPYLIDFERARRCLTARSAIKRDLSQFLKRAQRIPEQVLENLLDSHLRFHPKLTTRLMDRFYAR